MFAIVDQARRDDANGVLVLLDTQAEAEGIAFELRRRGHEVLVRGWDGQSTLPTPSAPALTAASLHR